MEKRQHHIRAKTKYSCHKQANLKPQFNILKDNALNSLPIRK